MLKSRRRLRLILLFSGLLSSGCAVPPRAPAVVAAHLEQDVRAFEAEVMNSYNRGDAARAASFYAHDAFVVGQEPTPTRGRDAIAANIARFMKDRNFSLGYVNEMTGVSASGDLAYTRGKLKVTFTDGKTKTVRSVNGNYILVMRREPVSGWQVVEDISFP